MLAVSKYPQDYIDAGRAAVAAQLAAYAAIVKAAKGASANGPSPLNEALVNLEHAYFNNALLALDHRFVNRLRNAEGKDGNPLNETRVICSSLMDHDGVMTAEKSIKLKPEESLLKYDYGDRVALQAKSFRRLAEAFLAEIEARYG